MGEIAILGDDPRNMRALPGRENPDRYAGEEFAAGNQAAIAAEPGIRPVEAISIPSTAMAKPVRQTVCPGSARTRLMSGTPRGR
jgi:hypothetical protein